MSYVILDNTSPNLSAPDWVTIHTGQTLGGSVSRANNTKDFTSFTITFDGIFADFYIVVSPFTPDNLPSSVTMILDGGSQVWDAPAFRHEDVSSTGQVARHWFTTPRMDAKAHTITVTNFPPHFSLDYVTITDTSPTDELVAVNDQVGDIYYAGTWACYFNTTMVVPLPFSEDQLSLEAFKGHACDGFFTPVGSPTSATYKFIGTSIFVYGKFEGPWKGHGYVTVAFDLDGYELKKMFFADGPQVQANYLWFESVELDPGSHTIKLTVLDAHDMYFNLDYFIVGTRPYIPPNHYSTDWPPASPFPYAQEMPNWTLPNATTVETWGYTKSSQIPKSTVIGVSIGVVVGVLMIGGILLFWFRYRARRKRASNQDERRNVPFAIY